MARPNRTELKDTGKLHKGAPRIYWCSQGLDEKGMLTRDQLPSQCGPILRYEGEPILACEHGPMRRRRNLSPGERTLEAAHKSQLGIGPKGYEYMAVWADIAKRKAKCHLCEGEIIKGERRIAFDSSTRGRSVLMTNGGVITRRRQYVHATCFVDIIMGGHPGDGCPGCSAKVLDEEFRSVKKILKSRYA
jgi:hypothetical protein